MRVLVFLISLVFAFLSLARLAYADTRLFLGPQIGSTSATRSNGASDRESMFSYGAEGFYHWSRYAAGVSYRAFDSGAAGTDMVNVKQLNQWVSASGKYKILDEDFTPYAGLGLGTIFKTVTTQVMGVSENVTGTFFVPDVGLGFWGRLSSAVGLDCGIKYYWYSNVSGWDYSVSVGILTDWL